MADKWDELAFGGMASPEAPKRNALVAGVSSGIDDLQGLGYSGIAALGDVVGSDTIKNWGDEGAARNKIESARNGRPDLENIQDISWGNAASMLAYHIGKQLPNVAGAIATAAAIPEVVIPTALARGAAFVPRMLGGGGLTAVRASAGGIDAVATATNAGMDLARGIAGGAAFNYGTGVGSMYDAASENPDNKNPGATAFLGAIPHALAETVPEAMLFGKLAHGSGATGNLLTRMGKNFAVQGASGATSELTQGELEMAVGKDLTDEEKFSRRLNSGVIGGVVEGVFGLPGAVRRSGAIPGNNPIAGAINDNDVTNMSSLTPEQIANQMRAKVVADSEAVAAANLQKKQEDAAKAQADKQQEHDDGFAHIAGTFGIRPKLAEDGTPTGQFTIGAKPIFTQNDAKAFIAGLEQASAHMTPEQRTLIGATINAGVVPVSPGAPPKAVVGAVDKFLKANQLDTAANPAEVIARIDALIDAISDDDDVRTDGKGAKFAGPLNDLHKELTGNESPAMLRAIARNEAHQAVLAQAEADKQAAKDAAKAAKTKSGETSKKTSAPKVEVAKSDPTAPGAVVSIPVDQYNQTGASNGQLQTPAGVGEVSEPNGANEAGGDANRDVRLSDVQSVGAGSVVAGQDGKQNDTSRAGGDGQSTIQPSNAGTTGIANEQTQKVKATLPQALAGAKPRYAYGNKQFELKFDSDIDKAAFITAQKVPSPSDKKYLEFVMNATGLTEAEVRAHGAAVKASLKVMAGKSKSGGTITVPAVPYLVVTDNINTSGVANGTQRPTTGAQRASTGNDVSRDGSPLGKTEGATQEVQTPAAGSDAGISAAEQTGGVNDGQRTEGSDTTQVQAARGGYTGDGGTGASRTLGDARNGDAVLRESIRTDQSQEGKGDARRVAERQGITLSRHGQVFKALFAIASPREQHRDKKVDFYKRYFGTHSSERSETITEIADSLGVSRSTVARWSAGLPNFFEDYAHVMPEAIEQAAHTEGVTIKELTQDFRELLELRQSESHNGRSEVQREIFDTENDRQFVVGGKATSGKEAAAKDAIRGTPSSEESDGAEGQGVIRQNSTGESKSAKDEIGNKESNAYDKWVTRQEQLQEALYKAEEEGGDVEAAQDALDAHDAKLDGILKAAEKAHKKGVRTNLSSSDTKDSDTADAPEAKAPKKPAKTKPAPKTVPAKKETALERAARMWDKAVAAIPGAVEFDGLSHRQQQDFAEFEEKDQTPQDVMHFMTLNGLEPVNTSGTHSIENSLQNSASLQLLGIPAYTAKTLQADIDAFIKVRNPDLLRIVDSIDDLPDEIKNHPDMSPYAQGFVVDGNHVYLVANNIPKGRGRAVFLHEIGGHRGVQELLDSEQFNKLVDTLLEWSTRKDGSIEAHVARAALRRVASAGVAEHQYTTELVAYAIEEAAAAGVTPGANNYSTAIGRWLSSIYRLFSTALRRLGFAPTTLQAQDLIDLAYGAAHYTMINDNPGSQLSARADQEAVQLSKADARIAKNTAILPKAAQPYTQALSKLMQKAVIGMSFTKDLIERAKKDMPAALEYIKHMGRQVAIRNEERRRVEKIGHEFEALSAAERDQVNALLKDSTTQGKWAFAPSWLAHPETKENKTKVDPVLAQRYDALSPEAQQVVRNVFAHGYASIKQIQMQLTDTTTRMYDEGIENALAAGDEREAERLRKDKEFELKDKNKLMDVRGENPYAPLGRFGNHVVTMRSKAMVAAQHILDKRDSGKFTEEQIKEAEKFVKAHRSDPMHFQVEFAENGVQAAKIESELKKLGHTQSFMREEAAQKFGGPQIQGLLYRARNLLNDQEDDKLSGNRRALNNLLTNLHLNLLHEQSSRKSEHQRQNIAGSTDNMMRSFHQHGIGNASFMAGLYKAQEIQDSLEQMRQQAEDVTAGNRDERQALYNEIAARFGIGIELKENAVVTKVLQANSVFMLLTKPLYFVQNGVQPWTMSLPYLAGRFQGRAVSAMVTAYRDVAGVMTRNALTGDVIAKLPKDVQQAVHELMAAGELNIDLDQEMGDRLKGSDVLGSVTRRLQNVAERLEGVNRVVTAVAAYRLAKPTMGHARAVEYAAKTVYDTHGDYSGANAPRLMRTQTGRVLTQFRKFQLIQVSLIAKLCGQAFSGANVAEKAVGRYALAYTLGSTFAFGGLMALPGYKAIAWIVGRAIAMAGDDEPEDPDAQEARMRRAIGDSDLANFLLKGVPKSLGVDMEPIFGGYSGMLSLLPYTKIEDMSKSTATNIIMGALGPTASSATRIYEGAGKLAEGEYVKGLAKILPTGISNIVQAFDKQANGLTRPNGATILKPDEIGVFDTALAAVGLRTNTIGDREFINRVETTYEAYFRDEVHSIQHKYVKAYNEGDSEAMQQSRKKWQALNDKRREYGFKPQPLSDLFKAPANARKYDMRTQRTLDRAGANVAGFAR